MEEIHIELLRADEIEQAAGILSRAFAVELNNLAIFRGAQNMEQRQLPLFRHMLKGFPGTILAAKQKNSVVGVLCMVKWPRCQMPRLKMLQYFAGMIMILRGGLLREMRLRRVWAKYDPKEPHWHIGPIGIEPALQNKGIGSELMKCFLRLADESHQPAYLETDRIENVRFYQRFNFSVIDEEVINGVCNWFMWRLPDTNE
jgi:ribosomal protein S18 acetylase RimI-like enzyme